MSNKGCGRMMGILSERTFSEQGFKAAVMKWVESYRIIPAL